MTLTVGLQIFHNGLPVRLLYRISSFPDRELWQVQPLFTLDAERAETFRPQDRYSKLHTQH
jgi:hypothetical protein